MDHDLTIMIYGAIMGVVGSILTSLISTIFQFWLERREYERRQKAERSRQLKLIHLPTDEEIIRINESRDNGDGKEAPGKATQTGTIALSTFVGGALVYQAHDPLLGFAFSFMLGFLLTKRVTRALRR